MMNKIRKNKTYRNAYHTQSVLTITSNVVYGKKTGYNSMMEEKLENHLLQELTQCTEEIRVVLLASLASVAKFPYEHSQDGISNTFSISTRCIRKDR